MKVKDYYSDMVLNQKWAIEVETTLIHCGSDYYETDGYGNPVFKSTESCENVSVSTYHYSVPFVGRCRYLDSDVRYFRVVDDTIYLCIKEFDEV